MSILAALLTAALLPPPDVAIDTADIVEINHVYRDTCELSFSQAIWWDDTEHGERVVAWRRVEYGQPTPLKEPTGYVCRWYDGERLRVVTAIRYRESWTHNDPEMDDRTILATKQRRGLLR